MYSRSKGFVILCSALFMFVMIGCQSTTGTMADQTINDAAISAVVQAKLMSDRVSNFFHVDVNTQGGIVNLSGIVDTDAERAQAERLARQVEGVREVQNDLKIRNRPRGQTFQRIRFMARG